MRAANVNIYTGNCIVAVPLPITRGRGAGRDCSTRRAAGKGADWGALGTAELCRKLCQPASDGYPGLNHTKPLDRFLAEGLEW